MATAPVGCEPLVDLTVSSPESSDVDLYSDAGSDSDGSVIVTEVIRYVCKLLHCLMCLVY